MSEMETLFKEFLAFMNKPQEVEEENSVFTKQVRERYPRLVTRLPNEAYDRDELYLLIADSILYLYENSKGSKDAHKKYIYNKDIYKYIRSLGFTNTSKERDSLERGCISDDKVREYRDKLIAMFLLSWARDIAKSE